MDNPDIVWPDSLPDAAIKPAVPETKAPLSVSPERVKAANIVGEFVYSLTKVSSEVDAAWSALADEVRVKHLNDLINRVETIIRG